MLHWIADHSVGYSFLSSYHTRNGGAASVILTPNLSSCGYIRHSLTRWKKELEHILPEI